VVSHHVPRRSKRSLNVLAVVARTSTSLPFIDDDLRLIGQFNLFKLMHLPSLETILGLGDIGDGGGLLIVLLQTLPPSSWPL